MDIGNVDVDREMIEAKIASYTETDLEEIRIQYSEYKNALGPEATKSFSAFISGIAAMNCLFEEINKESV